MFFVDFNRCMNNYRHAKTGELVWKGHRLLTNAPWLMSLGVLCDGTHRHTPLEGVYTKKSQEYDWNMCVLYARQHKQATQWLKLLHCRLPVVSPQPGMTRTSINAIRFDQWPRVIHTYLVDDLDRNRIDNVFFSEDDAELQLAPLRFDPERASAEQIKHHEEEFAHMLNWITQNI